MIRYVKRLQARRGKRHPVGMTFMHPGGSNDDLRRSPADWISPFGADYMTNPPVGDGRKVVVSDTDHHCGLCGDDTFAWRSLLRGLNPIYMDLVDLDWYDASRVGIRSSLGQTRRYARRIDLAASRPRPALASTGYALAARGREYLVYQPDGGPFTVDLRGTRRRLALEWFRPATDTTIRAGRVSGGGVLAFTPPFPGAAVLYLRAAPFR
jgi:hypothetical protein